MKCAHCRLNFQENQMIKKNDLFFCCKGCQSVYEILYENGLDEFYKKLGDKTLKPVSNQNGFKSYDEFINKTKEGFSEVYLVLYGIECAACIWLNEKILIKQQGILELDINHFTHKARIVFDQDIINLKDILNLIESIGYKASAYDPTKTEQKANLIKREFYSKLIVAIACVMNIMWIAIAKYAGFFTGMDKDIKDILNFAEFILCFPVLFYTGSSFYQNAFRAIKNKKVNMDTLVISGASLAFLYSLWAMFFRVGEVYFDSVAMIVCFVFIGKYLQVLSKKIALDTIDGLNAFLKNEVLVFNGKEFKPKSANEVKLNDIILLRSGDKILIDGVCIRGEASLDTSSLNGENTPLLIRQNDELNSACIVLDGSIEYRATKLYKDSKLAIIIKLLELASTKKAKLESLVSKISGYFSPVILFFSFACFCFWFFLKDANIELSLVNAISVLIIACPCALALATPVSTLVALGKSLKEHIIFKHSSTIEDLSKINMAIFDKTGTLTNNELKISNFYLDDKIDKEEFYSFIKLSNHPVSKSIAKFFEAQGIVYKKLDFKELFNIQARGLKANLNNDLFLGGNYYFLRENGIEVKEFKNTHFIFAKNQKIFAYFEFENILREGTKELIAYLYDHKIETMILSGDNHYAVEKIAKELKITNYKASCLPEDKMKVIENLNQKYKVLFVGDGINDALALKNASVSIALKQGSDLAIQSSDVLLLKNDLFSLIKALKLSKNTYKIIKQNLFFSLFYNALTIPLAFLGLINPLIAALSMSFSSIIVILNALRIK
ncbi:heavy metal translocating P-type ATPase metal-binding domain-containing protein [Campylobacter sp. TTU-622]|uniref:heavy metal translocating P-type ATPase n=1 Tax=Campylobacter sp. TTU-622 TaxID=2800583 RepID=UPI00190305C4|nr:heavy metal translocating P-type ATPase [Campylobacter sp. TTU-622]MBK1973507.1 heavy metal translocating P-type ATPase metal-binding domain-containing protein [Campylobacter sp. TTU-622]